jgi:toxin YoeB
LAKPCAKSAAYTAARQLISVSLVKSIVRDGALAGEGKPEKLKHHEDEYSRRVDDKNRLVYRCFADGTVEVMSCKGHYNGN